MKLFYHFYQILIVFAFFTVNLFANNTAHTNWDLLDKPIRRGLWIWHTKTLDADVLVDFCKNKSINEVYLFVAEFYWGNQLENSAFSQPEELAALITKLKAGGINRVWGVYYMYDPNNGGINYMGDTVNGEHIRAAQKVMDVAAEFNLRYPDAGLYGMQNDNEPKSNIHLGPFIEFSKAATERAEQWNDSLESAGAQPLMHSAALRPAWVNNTQKLPETSALALGLRSQTYRTLGQEVTEKLTTKKS